MKKRSKKVISLIIAVILVIGGMPHVANQIAQASSTLSDFVSPVETYGTIQIADYDHDGNAKTAPRRQLCDKDGKPIQLKGMSTFGLQWEEGSWILNDAAFDALAYDWKCDIVRLAMYVEEDGYAKNPAKLLGEIEKGIQLATDRGMYVMIDWHILTPGNPMDERYLKAGVELPQYAEIKAAHPEYTGPQLFFAYLSQQYGDYNNILWEVANEPNGLGSEQNASSVWKEKLLPYHQSVVSAIREYDKDEVDNIIICGTDNWSQFVDAPIENPVQDKNNQIMYTMHFYAGTHDTQPGEDGDYWLQSKVKKAIDNGLAVFCTEWGTSQATGDGGPYINYASRWLEFLKNEKISWTNWSLATKNEISAAMNSSTPKQPIDHNGDGIPEWVDDELSVSGHFVRSMIREEEVPLYEDSIIAEDFEQGIGRANVNVDSPNQAITLEEATINNSKVLKVRGIDTSGVWNNRVGVNDLGTTYGIYKDLIFQVYIPKSIDVSKKESTVLSVKPVIQSEATKWWGDGIPEESYKVSDLIDVKGTDFYQLNCKISMEPLATSAKDSLGHVLFLLSLTDVSKGQDLFIDNIGFHTAYNGDVSELPKIPDEPGTFIKLPYDFESGQREGWAKESVSSVDYTQIRIETAETKALCFPVSFDTTNNEWEDGARLSSSFFPADVLNYDTCSKLDAVALNVYIEKDVATTGVLQLNICPIPNGDGYWYQTNPFTIDPQKGIEVEGTNLLKYYVYCPLSNNGKYPFSKNTPIRNLILALQSNESDYKGLIYYDNIRFLDKENLDETDLEVNKKYVTAQKQLIQLEQSKGDVTEKEREAAIVLLTKLNEEQLEYLNSICNLGEYVNTITAKYVDEIQLPDTSMSEEQIAMIQQKVDLVKQLFSSKTGSLVEDSIQEKVNKITDTLNKIHTVTFDYNGATGSVNQKIVMTGEVYGTLPVPVKEKHTFIGWFTKKNGGAQVTETTVVTMNQDHSLYAKWKADKKVPVKKIQLNHRYLMIKQGKTNQLTATVLPENATNKKVVYSSSNERCVRVKADGTITANKPGFAVISCKATDGSGAKAYCIIFVRPKRWCYW